jgi:peptidoglycan/LPS O-acetylase OafA/YrhL
MTTIQQAEIKSLTGLRGIAALYVVLYHFKAGNFFEGVPNTFFHHGYLAVDLFFVLSGFVMALTYHSDFINKVTLSSYKELIGRRIARVHPLYLMMTLLFTIFYWLVPNKIPHDVEFSATAIVSNLFLIQAWGIAPSIVSAGWSISTEFAAYLLFPFLVLVIFSYQKIFSHLIALISMTVIIIISQSSLGSIYEVNNVSNLNIWQEYTLYPLIRCLCEFIIGMWAYRLYRDSCQAQNKLSHIIHSNWPSLILAIIIFCGLCIPKIDAFIVFLLPFFIISLANDSSPVAKIISWKPLYLLGLISYSLYLCHLMIFWIRSELIELLTRYQILHTQLVALAIQISISLVTASFFYLCVEKPGRLFFRKILDKKN